jgi:hypothetical protein
MSASEAKQHETAAGSEAALRLKLAIAANDFMVANSHLRESDKIVLLTSLMFECLWIYVRSLGMVPRRFGTYARNMALTIAKLEPSDPYASLEKERLH